MQRLLHLPKLTDTAKRQLMRGGERELWNDIEADINSNSAQVFQAPNDTYIVLRIVDKEMVILAAAGQDGNQLMQTVIDIARFHSLESVRFHTSRKGLHRLLSRFNPVEIERVYRVYL